MFFFSSVWLVFRAAFDAHLFSQFLTFNPSSFPPLPRPLPQVSDEIKELFGFIGRYTPHAVELETRIRPFIPDFVPAIGDVDPFIKPPRPDGKEEALGSKYLDEPSANQSDPTVLNLQVSAVFREGCGCARNGVSIIIVPDFLPSAHAPDLLFFSHSHPPAAPRPEQEERARPHRRARHRARREEPEGDHQVDPGAYILRGKGRPCVRLYPLSPRYSPLSFSSSPPSLTFLHSPPQSIADLHRSKPPPSVHYAKPMPDIEVLMQVRANNWRAVSLFAHAQPTSSSFSSPLLFSISTSTPPAGMAHVLRGAPQGDLPPGRGSCSLPRGLRPRHPRHLRRAHLRVRRPNGRGRKDACPHSRPCSSPPRPTLSPCH
jgi:hypothetical protein